MRRSVIDPVSLARFVSEHPGLQGAALRLAAADHHGVSLRAVERAFPRAVASGHLSAEILPGRGAPMRYLAAAKKRAFGKYRTLGDLHLTETPMVRAARLMNVDPEKFADAWSKGSTAFCDRCGRSTLPSPYLLGNPTPTCSRCSVEVDGRWVPKPMLVNRDEEPRWPTSPGSAWPKFGFDEEFPPGQPIEFDALV